MASASPMAMATVVLAVGARFSEQASSFTLTSSTTSLAAASVESSFSRQRDQRHFQALERFQQAHDFFCFAAIGNCHEHVSARQHSQIAMQRFGGMQEK